MMKNNQGFTLIEVLVSMFVLSVGLLGLAGMQATGLKNNLSSYNRSQATLLAYDIADRIRANKADTDNLASSIYLTLPATDALIQNSCRKVAETCTPAQMAQNDLYEWNRILAGGPAVAASGDAPALVAVAAKLPLATGAITGVLVGAPPNQVMTYTVTINWDDNRDGCLNPRDRAVTGCTDTTDQPDDPNFQMSFQL